LTSERYRAPVFQPGTATDHPCRTSVTDSSIDNTQIVFPWTTRSPAFGVLAYLAPFTLINLLFGIYLSWTAHHIWHQNRQNLILTENQAIITAAWNAVAVSTGLAGLYASMYYWRNSELTTLRRIGMDVQVTGDVQVEIGGGLYWYVAFRPSRLNRQEKCRSKTTLMNLTHSAFACPLFALAWLGLLWYRQRKAARPKPDGDVEKGLVPENKDTT
jgi:hypothetical protein